MFHCNVHYLNSFQGYVGAFLCCTAGLLRTRCQRNSEIHQQSSFFLLILNHRSLAKGYGTFVKSGNVWPVDVLTVHNCKRYLRAVLPGCQSCGLLQRSENRCDRPCKNSLPALRRVSILAKGRENSVSSFL